MFVKMQELLRDHGSQDQGHLLHLLLPQWPLQHRQHGRQGQGRDLHYCISLSHYSSSAFVKSLKKKIFYKLLELCGLHWLSAHLLQFGSLAWQSLASLLLYFLLIYFLFRSNLNKWIIWLIHSLLEVPHIVYSIQCRKQAHFQKWADGQNGSQNLSSYIICVWI